MKQVIFDMETGDPDDLITLLLLLKNKQINLKAVTCYQGSPTQIGLIQYIISLSGKDIPIGGWNTEEPKELIKYYQNVVGNWNSQNALHTPVEIFNKYLTEETLLLTGAPLSNIKSLLDENPDFHLQNMVVQGGFLGSIIPEDEKLPKFKKTLSIQTYNLSSDPLAFDAVFQANNFQNIVFVTKDLCHGFTYSNKFHSTVKFPDDAISQILFRALNHYVLLGKEKALHDPLAMTYLLNSNLGDTMPIVMSYESRDNKHFFHSYLSENSNRFGLINYKKEFAWQFIKDIIENKT